jgi:hypothetical protein
MIDEERLERRLQRCGRTIRAASGGRVLIKLWNPPLENKTGTWHETPMSLIPLHDRDVDKWTLRQVLERGALAFECQNCGHLAQIDVLELVARFGPDKPVATVRAKTVCRMCGGRRVRSLVRLKVGRKDLAWVPVPPRKGR